jgi:hypothetical protein
MSVSHYSWTEDGTTQATRHSSLACPASSSRVGRTTRSNACFSAYAVELAGTTNPAVARGGQIFNIRLSRSAFTARSLAGLIARCGMRRDGSAGAQTLLQIFAPYRCGNEFDPLMAMEQIVRHDVWLLSFEKTTLQLHRRCIPIEKIGAWDTVALLGITWTSPSNLGQKHTHFQNWHPSRVCRRGFNGFELDENRGPYPSTQWTDFSPDDPDPVPEGPWHQEQLKQRCFSRAHSDLGGANKVASRDRPITSRQPGRRRSWGWS